MNDPQNKSTLAKLIAELCPDGVEFKTLGEISLMQRGTATTKKNVVEGKIPVISGGKEPAYYCNQYNRDGETITIAGSGVGAGFVKYWNEPVFVADAFSVKACDNCSTKYLYYCLANVQEKIYGTQKGGGIPHVHISSVENFMIPVPPLEVQREIVRILDKFTELGALLEKELVARKKQYEYYSLKIFERLDAHAEMVTISSLGKWSGGKTPSMANKDFWDDGTIPWFVMEDIRKNGRVLSDSIQHVTPEAVKGNGLFKANSIIMATSATIGEHALITVDHLSNQRFINLKIRDAYSDLADIKYLFYYAFVIDEWCKKNTSVSSFATVDMAGFRKLEIPLPPLPEQHRIAGILDRFDALCNDLSSGIPAEIAARKKQYEYYRDRLLTFKEKN